MSRSPESQDRIRERLGANIRAARTALGLTQGELAGGDVTRNMLSRIENGAALPSLTTLCAIAERLGVPPGALLGDLDGYSLLRITDELRKLLVKKRYSELLDRLSDYLEKTQKSESELQSPELNYILIEALTKRAGELFAAGKLTAAAELIERADMLPDPPGFDVSGVRKRALTCGMLISANPGQKRPSDGTEQLRKAIFDENGSLFYVLARELLSNAVGQAYSVPDEHAPEYRRVLDPLLEQLPDGFIRSHIEAKLEMAEAEYLSAKAKMLPLIDGSLPPSVLYELYTDLEHCCKCCGDFENAYKYASEKLALLQKIK